MDQDKQESRKRVSFAAEPQINYIYNKEHSTSTTNSYCLDSAMDITTELQEFKNLNLFVKDENLKEEEDELIEPNTNLAKRMSLDPLKYAEQDIFAEENEFNVDTNNSNIKNVFWRSSIKNEPRKSLNTSFEDTAAINSSFAVDELVNTIDLRKIIPQEWQEKKNITDFLISNGIRFLDETAVTSMKRDTLSKSRNIVDPKLMAYYKYSLSERIEFLYNFSTFLIDKMKDLQKEIEVVESEIDVDNINKDNLKRMRNEARNKAKIDWYSLRKIYEIQFNKKMIENKSKVIDLLNTAKRENEVLSEQINAKTSNIETLKSKIADFKSKVSSFENDNVQKTEKLQIMIDERIKVRESVKYDLEMVEQIYNSQKKEEEDIQKRINKINDDINNIKKNIAIKNVSEGQLDEIKKQIEKYSCIYRFKIVKINKHSIILDVAGNIISAEINNSFDVHSCFVIKTDGDPFSEFSRSLIQNLQQLKLQDFILRCLEIFYHCFALRKEINNVKEKAKVECFYLNSNLYIRIHPADTKLYLDLSITNGFDLIHNEKICSNLKSSFGSLTSYINGCLIK